MTRRSSTPSVGEITARLEALETSLGEVIKKLAKLAASAENTKAGKIEEHEWAERLLEDLGQDTSACHLAIAEIQDMWRR